MAIEEVQSQLMDERNIACVDRAPRSSALKSRIRRQTPFIRLSTPSITSSASQTVSGPCSYCFSMFTDLCSPLSLS